MRLRWNDLPLRWRLTFLYVGLLLIVLTILGTFLYFNTRHFMVSATASRLEALANSSINHSIPGERPVPPPRSGLNAGEPITSTVPPDQPSAHRIAEGLARDLTWQDTTAVVLDSTGAIIADGRFVAEQPAIPTPDDTSIARAVRGETVSYVAKIGGYDTLAVLIPFHFSRSDPQNIGIVQVSAPLDVVDQVLYQQGVSIVIGLFATLLVAAVGGLWLTQTALKPLRLMIDTCRRIAGGDLSQRVNLPQRRDETGQLAAAFDEMVAQLDDTFTAQRQFVADASHELRTPLTAIGGSLEVLLLAPEGDPETTRRVLHGMRREVQRLTRLVTDLLTLTRLDARRSPKMQPVDLAMLGREVIENIKPLAKNRTITLEVEGDSKCTGDADQLKQVFYNLLGNAIQSTDAETGQIVLRVQSGEHEICVGVSDNGSGIPESAQPHIFERFYRVDKARTRASGGSGLGLAIVKAIVEGHNGRIEPVESAAGKGTTIRFTLPRGR